MKIITKRIKVIQMTSEEMQKFQELMRQAEQGSMQHYAEDRLEDGSYLGVAVVSEEEKRQQEHIEQQLKAKWKGYPRV